MATLALHQDSSAGAFARAGEAMVRRWANAEARVLDHTFAVVRKNSPALPSLDGLAAQSRLIEILALRQDIDAAPVDLYEGNDLSVDAVPFVIAKRFDQDDLGQVTFHLEPR